MNTATTYIAGIHNRDVKIQRLHTTEYGWMCAAHVWSTGSSTDHRGQKNGVKLIDGKVQTTVKAWIPLSFQKVRDSLIYCTMHINQRVLSIRTGNMKIFVSIH